MELQSRIKSFLLGIPENTEDRTYYESVFDVLVALDPPLEEDYGFACMNLLEYYCIWLKDGRDINGPNHKWYATFGEIAEAIAVTFASIHETATWWKVRYVKMRETEAVMKAAEELLSKLKRLKIVERVGDFSEWQ